MHSRDKHGKKESSRKFGVVEEDASETEAFSGMSIIQYSSRVRSIGEPQI